MFNDLKHTWRTVDILKIYCECEYAAIPPLFDMIATGVIPVNWVLVELHNPSGHRKDNSPQMLEDFLWWRTMPSYRKLTKSEIIENMTDIDVWSMFS